MSAGALPLVRLQPGRRSRTSPPGVTAVISTHNRCNELSRTLRQLGEIDHPALEVIVVDNASDDGTRSLLRRHFPDVRLVPHSANRPLRGYNLAFSLVTTPYVLVLDDDSAPRPGTLNAMVEQIEKTPGAGAAAANILGPDGTSEWGDAGKVAFSADWYNLIGCGFLARTNVVRKAGGYNETFELYYNDLDLALRMLALGHCILYSSTWIVDHRRSPVSRIPERKLFHELRNFPSLTRRHLSGWRRWDVIAGHTAICLGQAAREGCLARSIPWLGKGLAMPAAHGTLPLQNTPAAAGFIGEYSLLANVRRRLSGRTAPRPRAVPAPVRLLDFRGAEPGPDPAPCYWRLRIDSDDPAVLSDERAIAARRARDEAGGCDCAATLGWYRSPWREYQRLLLRTAFLSCSERRHQRAIGEQWDYRPRISLLTAVHDLRTGHLEECLLSVERQTYADWELCLVDDHSGIPENRERLRSFASRHGKRVRLVLRDENWGIARTLQQALEMSTGEFVAVLDHDDRLAPEALHEIVAFLNLHPETDWVYTDSDKISPDGGRWYYHFKPDWSPDLLLSYNYTHHLSVMRRELVQEVGGFREEFNGAQDYDLYLRLAERTSRVGHVPRVLYSWRQSESSVAVSMETKPYVAGAGLRALDASLKRSGDPGRAEHDSRSWVGNYRVRRDAAGGPLDIAILGTGRQSGAAFQDWATHAGGMTLEQRFTATAGELDGAALSRALRDAASPSLLVVDAMARPASSDVLAGLVSCLGRAGVGAVAPAIIDEAGSFDHCGLVLAPGGTVLYPLRGLPGKEAHYGAYGALARNVSAVSPVAVLFSVAALRESGGFDPSLGAAGAIVDACLGLRLAGHRIIVDGGLRAIFGPKPFEVGSRMSSGGRDLLSLVQKRPRLTVAGDPYYNRNLGEIPTSYGVREVP